MVEPIVIPRSQHTLSRRDIDADALRVLYRLHQAQHLAYLVGGSVRDLLLGRRPKDFDIGTSAHPYQVKRLFRNCWIIGRRFRLAHVKFGPKTIEVATFRRQVGPGTEAEPPLHHAGAGGGDPVGIAAPEPDHLIHRDNTFGTPEEDAFRRDFTVNALFYDIATFSLIDYVGGLGDLRDRVIRSIGDPEVRFREDPVRMLRAIVLGARLSFTIHPPTLAALRALRGEITRAAPARMMEEYYKILRYGASARTFADLGAAGLLEHVSPEIPSPLPPALEASLARLDAFRGGHESVPDVLTNPILLGSLIVPLGFSGRRLRRRREDGREEFGFAAAARLGDLPVPRRDVERLAQVLGLQRRLLDTDASPRAQAQLVSRTVFRDALTWLTIHGDAPEIVAHWERVLEEHVPAHAGAGREGEGPRRRRRRRRPQRQ